MRADGDERIGRQPPDLLPVHHEIGAKAVGIDVDAVAKLAHEGARVGLVDGPQPPIDGMERGILLGRRAAPKPPLHAIELHAERIDLDDDLLERQPPQIAVPVRIVGGHVNGEGEVVALEDRVGVFEIVAVAVIEREADEGLAMLALDQAEMRLVERDDLEAGGSHLADHLLEKIRRHLQDAVRLEAVGLLRADMMQHEDGADAARQRRDHAVRTGIMQGGQRSLEEFCATAHYGVTWPPILGLPCRVRASRQRTAQRQHARLAVILRRAHSG